MSELTFTVSEKDFIRTKFRLNEQQCEIFFAACERYNLNPIANQIYPQVRQGRLNITTGIDGYRLIADRTGKYAGNDDPIYDDEETPRRATVCVYKIVGGTRCAFVASARWDQYYPGDKQGFMWNKMPHLMLGKCAEALALRKAFPAELSGIYTNEEMEQAGPPVQPVQETIKVESADSSPLDAPKPEKTVVGASPEMALKGTVKVLDCQGKDNSSGVRYWAIRFSDAPDKTVTTFSETQANDAFDAMQYDLAVHVNTVDKTSKGRTYTNIENLTLAEIPAGKD